MVRGERALELGSVFLYQDLLGICLQMSAPTPAFATPPLMVLGTPTLSLFRFNMKAQGSASL